MLQISPSAEPETVHRVYRLLAQRYHPDNVDTGNEERFRLLSEAYRVITDPEQRARYDVAHVQRLKDRWRLVSTGVNAQNDFEAEQLVRLTVLEVLYTQRRVNPGSDGLSPLDLEQLLGRPREHLEFTTWYLVQKRYATRSDNSALLITVEGIDFLERNYQGNSTRLLSAARVVS